MKTRDLEAVVPAVVTAVVLALAGSAVAQSPTPAAKSSHMGKMATEHHASAKAGTEASGMKAECEAMMARRQAMQDKVKAMDATLDKLVAEMNAAKESKAPDALEKPMAAVLNELVTQRKAMHAMMAETQSSMMGHMGRHMHSGGMGGAMSPMDDCPMMKTSENEKQK